MRGQDEGVQADHVLGDSLSDARAGEAGGADHGEEVRKDFLFLFLEALIDPVDRQGKAVAGVQADQLGRLPQRWAMNFMLIRKTGRL